MKRCPQCGREYDLSMSFCLDDGMELLYGPGLSEPGAVADGFPSDEPATAILHATDAVGEAPTRAQIHTTEQTAVLPSGIADAPKTNAFDKRLILAPIALAAIVLGAFFGYRYFSKSDSRQISSIAVMPFENRNSDADTDYLSDGLAESLIYRLSQLPDLKVSPTSSVFRYKGKETDPQTVAKELGVDSVMTGRITQRGDNLTISVNLVDAGNAKSLWGEQYERKLSELLTTQREIVAEIVGKLQLKLSGESEQKLAKRYTVNPEAYQAYLKGRYYWSRRTAENLRKAIEQFRSATESDPNFALAYAGLADCYALFPEYAGTASSSAQAKAYAERALALDDQLAEPHATLVILYAQQFNWAEAEREGKRVVELNPNYPTGFQWYASILLDIGKVDEAAAMYKRASELDPLSGAINDGMTNIYQVKKDYEACIANSLKFIEIDPSFPATHRNLAFCYLKMGRNAEAIAEIEKAALLDNRTAWVLGDLGYVYARTGNKAEANAIIEELIPKVLENNAGGRYVAVIFAGLDHKDQVIEWLEKDIVANNGRLGEVRWTIPFESFHGDPRFKEMLKRMNLPE